MKYNSLLFLAFIILLQSCNSGTQTNEISDSLKRENKAQSIRLNDKALLLISGDSSKIDSALLLVNQAIMLDSANLIAHINKMNWLCKNNNFQEAFQEARLVDKREPGNPETIFLQGLLAEKLDKMAIAQSKYQEAFLINDKKFKGMDSDEKMFQLVRLNWAANLYFLDQNKGLQEFKKIESEYPENNTAKKFLKLQRQDLLIKLIHKR